MKRRKNHISVYSFFTCLGITLMMLSDLLVDMGIRYLDYADEIVAICCLLLAAKKLLSGKIHIWVYYIFFLGTLVLGLIGNIIWGIQDRLPVVLTDLFLFSKPYMIMFYFHITMDKDKANKIYRFLMLVSKAMVVIIAAFSVITLVIPMGMRTSSGTFQFLNGFSGGTSWWTILFFAVISSDRKNKRTLYYLLSVLIILQSGSGLGILALTLAILIYLFVEIQKKFHWYYLLLVIPLCLWVGKNEIAEYLMNHNAPRYLLFYYGFLTANRFFPLGAGFATYGSTTAISHYSKLYEEYGFGRRWGMSEAFHPYLMDSYFPQIIGQFGYVGACFYGIFIFLLLKKFIFKITDKNCKCSCLYLFFCWLIAGFGFGTASSWGCTIYLLLPVLKLAKAREGRKAGVKI